MHRSKLLLFAVISIVIVLAILEFAARLVEFVSPGQRSSRYASELTISAKPEGAFRVLVFGGSTVVGYPVEELGFVSQLEHWLRQFEPEQKLEVYNLAMIGRSSAYVRQMVERTRGDRPDLLIVMTGHNEYLGGEKNGEGIDRLSAALRKLAFYRVQTRVMKRIRSALDPDWDVVRSEAPRAVGANVVQQVESDFKENLRAVVQIASEEEIPVILITLSSNVADWPPFRAGAEPGSTSDADFESRVATVADLVANGRANRAVGEIETLLATHPDDAYLHYLMGRANRSLGNRDSARAYFEKAKSLDLVRWRARGEINQAIRSIASLDGVYLVDVAELFEREAPDGLVDFSLIADNVHPTPRGHAIIAGEIIRVMNSDQLFFDRDLGTQVAAVQLDGFLNQFSREDREALQLEYLLGMAKYVMKTPFYNFTASSMYLRRALALDSSDWRVWANLATVSLLEDRVETGEEELREAVRLRGAAIDPGDRDNTPYLKEAIERTGVVMERVQ